MARGGGSWERDGSGPGSGSGQLSRSPYLNLISELRARGVARDGGSLKRDTRRRLGSGSDQLRPDSEARRGDPEPVKRGLGGQPVTPPGRATRPGPVSLTAPPVRRAVSTAAVRTGIIGSWLIERRSPRQGQRRPGGRLDVSARQACYSRLPLP